MNESRTDIAIRRSSASDARALRRLAALDSAAAPLAGPDVLIAEVGGRIVAAAHGERVIADPFLRTAEIVDLLRVRARQVTAVAPAALRPLRPARTQHLIPQG